MLPLGGGWFDQSPWFADAWTLYQSALGAAEREHERAASAWRRQRAAADAKRKG